MDQINYSISLRCIKSYRTANETFVSFIVCISARAVPIYSRILVPGPQASCDLRVISRVSSWKWVWQLVLELHLYIV
jgi:hypothetical protein